MSVVSELGERNPRACSAVVELTTLAERERRVAIEAVFDCRACPVFERFERVGSQEDVQVAVLGKVESIATRECKNFAKHGITSQEVTSDLLPQIIFS